jgi:hypothetical protein
MYIIGRLREGEREREGGHESCYLGCKASKPRKTGIAFAALTDFKNLAGPLAWSVILSVFLHPS